MNQRTEEREMSLYTLKIHLFVFSATVNQTDRAHFSISHIVHGELLGHENHNFSAAIVFIGYTRQRNEAKMLTRRKFGFKHSAAIENVNSIQVKRR